MFSKLTRGALFSTLLILSHNLSTVELAQPVAEELKTQRPDWKFEITAYHPSGGAKEIVFFEEQDHQRRVPMKKVTYFESGKICSEEDIALQAVVENDEEKIAIVPHGRGVILFEDGNTECILNYKAGQLHGPLKTYFNSGKVNNDFNFKEGQFHGPAVSYYASGQVKEEAYYDEGKPQKSYVTYYENGEKAVEKHFENGVLEGAVQEWYDTGQLMATHLFYKGNLHANNAPASIIYYENGKIKESKHAKDGQLDGLFVQYHSNSNRKYQVHYVAGKKEGKEQYFSEEGEVLGGGEYKNGRPINSHTLKFSNGLFERIANFDKESRLVKPVEEFYPSGQLKARYGLDEDGKLDSLFIEWYENEQVKQECFYAHGQMHGHQKEFFASGQMKREAFYDHGKEDGVYQEWLDDGQIVHKAEMKNGQKNGVFETWYDNGQPKVQECYDSGKLNGLSQSWYANGNLKARAEYNEGIQDGVFATWYEDGQSHQKVTFAQGTKDGVEEVYYPNGKKKYFAEYESGKLNGKNQTWFEDGHMQVSGTYVAGFPNGEHIEYHLAEEGGSSHPLKTKVSFAQGKRHGLHQEFYPNGQQQLAIHFKDGNIDGKKTLWNEDGQILEESFYQNGSLHGRCLVTQKDKTQILYHFNSGQKEGVHEVYYPEEDGKRVLALSAKYRKDELEGDVLEYNKSGKMLAKTPYKAGKKEGTALVYDEQGVLRLSVDYKNGEHHGAFKQYHANGKLGKESHYKDGQKHGGGKYL